MAIFLQTSQAATGKSGMNVSAEAMNVLMRYRWPGNVRELRAAIDFATLHSVATAILPEDLPPEIVPDLQPPPPSSTDEVPVWSPEVEEPMVDERQRIIDAVKEAKGKRSAAARLLGMSRATFYRRLNELDITLD